jgi:large subunit ribosomal protein L7/L12
MAKLSIDAMIDAIKELSVLELNDLVKRSEEVFGVSAAAAVAQGPAGTTEEKEEKIE